MSTRDEILADVRRAAGAVAEASANLPRVENPAGEAAEILTTVNGQDADVRLTEAFAALASARAHTAGAFNDLQRAWTILSEIAPL